MCKQKAKRRESPLDNQLTIAVCDDNAADRAGICVMTRNILGAAGISCEIIEYESGQRLLAAIEGGRKFHILLLDVLLDGMSGLELAAALRGQKSKAEIIFISTNRELAMLGYEVRAARYLAKPVPEEKLREALLYCSRTCQRRREIMIPMEHAYECVGLEEIAYVEAYDRGTKFYLAGRFLVSRMKFKEAEDLLCPAGFMVAHRSYLVNLSQVRSIRRYELGMKDGRVIPIGQARFLDIRRKFMDINAE